ncbi:MAG: hypothetical protein K0Q90_3180 [Paenibacillaceae bacterium]|jgi:3-dehydroshikimate dehydratase|nr:hypothetical protein [Paenibacillaceae bacterium]
MNIVFCSISFRHELVSFQELIQFADANRFSGFELWGVHGRSVLQSQPREIPYRMDQLEAQGQQITMLSDYIDLCADPGREQGLREQWMGMLSMARTFRTRQIRIFAGNKSAALALPEEWERCMDRLRMLAGIASEQGIVVVVETHSNTYADSLESALRILRDVNHQQVKVNVDFLHLWEAGEHPVDCLLQLKAHTVNYHLKNVASLNQAGIFAPGNVFSPSGIRMGMTPLAEGAIDYSAILSCLAEEDTPHPLALEWFGPEPVRYLRAEREWLGSWIKEKMLS